MNKEYIIPDNWNIIEEGFDPANVKSSESLFSIGNGAMGQRANFEEEYSGPTFQGSYIAGVYYPDKTRVGWWKNGYPEYFAKVLNAPNWIGVKVRINGQSLDLFTAAGVRSFRRELNMKEGYYRRSFEAKLDSGEEVRVEVTRLLHLELDELGMIRYNITPLNGDMEIVFEPYLDGGITNEDSNWDDKFWDTLSVTQEGHQAFIRSMTMKTEYHVCTYMESRCYVDGNALDLERSGKITEQSVAFTYRLNAKKGETVSLEKFGGYTVSLNHKPDSLIAAAKNTLERAWALGFDQLVQMQREAWGAIWEMADITIAGDVKAQQGIRFNIFQLNQTYLGKDARLNIGPKGFTGEKYGGSTYWDTEAYCLPFYMATKDHEVARNLLVYRYNHLQKAIENAKKLGFSGGAALYPMVTMNGEESHNEWEITFEEIHRNGAIAFAIYNYVRYTGDWDYVAEKGLEVLIAIARFWQQRANFSEQKGKYVILGVTGPNEYENNVNNNWYTNYHAKWCIQYAASQLEEVRSKRPEDYDRITAKTALEKSEVDKWLEVAQNMYFPYSEEHGVYLQQDGFLDKELVKVADLDRSQRPINQNWSWDRILRSPYIKQADTLQGFYFFEDHFTREELERHFDFYEPFTVHESSLSPCVHSIQAARLGRMDKAYEMYLRTSRLDLDDYNKEVEEGCHITSMAGTWLSIVEGFGGMRVQDDQLHFNPQLPEQWEGFSFKINFRGLSLKVYVNRSGNRFELHGDRALTIVVDGKPHTVEPSA
jgi:maltose phosphorylase